MYLYCGRRSALWGLGRISCVLHSCCRAANVQTGRVRHMWSPSPPRGARRFSELSRIGAGWQRAEQGVRCAPLLSITCRSKGSHSSLPRHIKYNTVIASKEVLPWRCYFPRGHHYRTTLPHRPAQSNFASARQHITCMKYDEPAAPGRRPCFPCNGLS